jgi:dihydrolipoamide dehydrogenase
VAAGGSVKASAFAQNVCELARALAKTQEDAQITRMSTGAAPTLPDASGVIVADVAVLGAGTAGLAAYRAAADITSRVVLIEGGIPGTTCARVGCMPSKLLIAAADAAHAANAAASFGVQCAVQVDSRRVMDRVHRERDRFVKLVLDGVDQIPPERRLKGYARFVEPGLLEVGSMRVHARAIVIATGATSDVPDLFDGVRDRVVVNDGVFEWNVLPESVAVFGAGAIGLELGQALHRLGVRVRVFGRGGSLGPLTDPAVRSAAVAALGAEMPIHPAVKVRAVRRVAEGVEVRFEDDAGQARAERFAFCLAATGRKPNLAGLALDRSGLALDARGIPRFDRATMQCGGAPVFIAGDVDQDAPVLHEAADEGKIAGENAARFPDVRPAIRSSSLSVIFTDPQIAAVGSSFASLSESAVRPEAKGGFVVGEVDFDDQGRSRVMLQNRGLLHVYATRERFLGAEMVGPRAEHLGHLLAWAHQQRMTVAQMLTMAFYHPVVEEGLRTALRDADAKLAFSRSR